MRIALKSRFLLKIRFNTARKIRKVEKSTLKGNIRNRITEKVDLCPSGSLSFGEQDEQKT